MCHAVITLHNIDECTHCMYNMYILYSVPYSSRYGLGFKFEGLVGFGKSAKFVSLAIFSSVYKAWHVD